MEEKPTKSAPNAGETDGHQARTVWKVYTLLRLPGMQDRQTSQKPSQRNRDEMPQIRRDLARRPMRNSDEEN